MQYAKHVVGLEDFRPQARQNACLSFWPAAFAGQGELRLPYDRQSGLLVPGIGSATQQGWCVGLHTDNTSSMQHMQHMQHQPSTTQPPQLQAKSYNTATMQNTKPSTTPTSTAEFAPTLVAWQRQAGRQHLPWQHTGNAYWVWLSEIMLQQTQVARVLGYFERFVQTYPTVQHLAQAAEADVMRLWAGLGYYRRAQHLHACARQVAALHGGVFPACVQALQSLPGIGRTTAGAIASLAFNLPTPILDGNVKRVLCRHFGIEGAPNSSITTKALWALAENLVPQQHPGTYNQALMDLGAMVCKPRQPLCTQCPVQTSCIALQTQRVHMLPSPNPKPSSKNIYAVAFLITDAQGRLVLQQNQAGTWRGLYLPPLHVLEAHTTQPPNCTQAALQAALQAISPMHAQLQKQWPPQGNGHNSSNAHHKHNPQEQLQQQPWLVHILTHRRWHLKTLHWQVGSATSQALHHPSSVAVPALMQKLLKHAGLC